jgi:integration host factor subunit beta
MFLDRIVEELSQGNRIELRDFGVFEVKKRAARKARNPRTGEEAFVPAKNVVVFKVGKLMKERVNNSASNNADNSANNSADSSANTADPS